MSDDYREYQDIAERGGVGFGPVAPRRLRAGLRPREGARRPGDGCRPGQPAPDRRRAGPGLPRSHAAGRGGRGQGRPDPVVAMDRRSARRDDQLRPRFPLLVRLDRAGTRRRARRGGGAQPLVGRHLQRVARAWGDPERPADPGQRHRASRGQPDLDGLADRLPLAGRPPDGLHAPVLDRHALGPPHRLVGPSTWRWSPPAASTSVTRPR